MDKYRMFDKVIKTKWYSFFKAQNIQTREIITVKKMHKEISWQQILKNKNISLMNNSKVKEIASIREIIKDQSNFYCIFQHLDHNLEAVIRKELQKDEIFRISRNLIMLMVHLHEHQIVPREIRPSALFVNENYHLIKIAHLDAYNQRDLAKLDLVELQDLRYSVPEVVLTSRDIDERSMVFGVGLIISQLILGKPLLNSNTKINYIYQMCKLFPQQNIQNDEQSRIKKELKDTQQTFQGIMSQFDFSNEFIALLREMLKIDRNQRIRIEEILEAFDLIVANQQNFIKDNQQKTVEAILTIKPNVSQAPVNQEIIETEITFQFEKKPTLSAQPNIKVNPAMLPSEKNVEDDAAQPIVIKKSSKQPEIPFSSMPVSFNKDAAQKSRATKQQTISTAVRRPQLTNYALNQGTNLGVKLGFQPTLFSENDNDI